MRGTLSRIGLIGILTIMCIGFTGCLQVVGAKVHDDAVKKFPTYVETKAAWGTVPDGYGRVVIFLPRLLAGGIGPGGFGYDVRWIKVDKLAETPVVDQTFVFVDLPTGKHSISLGGGVIFGPAPLVFDVIPGEIMYIDAHLKIVTSQEAEVLLENTHHSYQKPLPYDKQEKSADRVWAHM